jgi:hypothetical protein
MFTSLYQVLTIYIIQDVTVLLLQMKLAKKDFYNYILIKIQIIQDLFMSILKNKINE